MRQVKVKLNRSIVIGTTTGHFSGAFAEHLGRRTYGSPYELGHPSATPERLRGDMLELARRQLRQLIP
jgi:alpha-L-arabinofuranosidase